MYRITTPAHQKLRKAVSAAATILLAASGVAIAASTAHAAPLPTIVINEVESNGGTPADWVELYNTGTETVDVGGYIFMDSEPRTKAIPAGTTIAPGAYFTFVVDENPNKVGLGAADSARLFLADGTTLVDGTSWAGHATHTWGRCADGTGAFVQTTASTPGAANACPDASASLKINEAVSDGGTPGDWIEFVNTGDVPVDAGGLVVRDNDVANPYTIPAGTWVAAGGYLVLDNGHHFAFGLGKGDSVRLYGTDGTTLLDSTTWPAGTHAAPSWGRCPDASGGFELTTAATKGAANQCTDPGTDPGTTANVKINEVESSGGTPGDWVELINLDTDHAADLTGYRIRDNDIGHTAVPFPAGTTIESGGYLVIEEDALGFGLGSGDSVTLFAPDGTTVVDTTTWTGHASVTWARCPDGTGDLRDSGASTKGLANDCSTTDPGTDPEPGVEVWPGGTTLTAAPTDIPFSGDLSGLDYETPVLGDPTLWAVTNGTGVLSKLAPGTGGAWNGASGWGAGKQLAYPDGSTAPDAEGVTVADGGSAGGVYVATERSSAASSTSRPSILRFDVSGTGSTLTATNEWNLGADLTATVGTIGANSGLEGITWIPDAVLTARGFLDEATGQRYDPALYPNHRTGVFFVALEKTGDVYAYVLDLTGSGFTRIATIDTPGAMEVDYEPETQLLWAVCDEACDGRTATLQIGASGAYEVTHRYARPAASANYANEGFALAPQSACVAGQKPVYYADDANTDGVSLRVGSVRCTALPGGGDGGEPGEGENPGGSTPTAPGETDLTPATQGGVTGPSSARAGSTITVTVGPDRAGARVDGWVFSTPVHLGTHTVSAAGTVRLTLPVTLAAGAHRIAVLDADGAVIGWFAITVQPAALGATGADAAATDAGLALAALLLVAGAGLVLLRRASARSALSVG